jgi:hypothetical protein
MSELVIPPPYRFIAEGLKAGEVVPFFGAAASAVYRPPETSWQRGEAFLPFGGELAAELASDSGFPIDATFQAALADSAEAISSQVAGVSKEQAKQILEPVLRKHLGGPPDLALVASWAEHRQGHRRALNRMLRGCFNIARAPGALHERLAQIDSIPIYITTNYDDMLETALQARQPHLIVDRGERGLYVGVAGGALKLVGSTGSELYDLLNDPATQLPSRPIVFRMHGSIDKVNARNDHYLITEEDYVDFLGRDGGRSYLPPYVAGLIENKDFLFLGYSLADWNIRVIIRKLFKQAANLSRISQEVENQENKDDGKVRFWAVVRGRSDPEQEVWQAQHLNIYPLDLHVFDEQLGRRL